MRSITRAHTLGTWRNPALEAIDQGQTGVCTRAHARLTHAFNLSAPILIESNVAIRAPEPRLQACGVGLSVCLSLSLSLSHTHTHKLEPRLQVCGASGCCVSFSCVGLWRHGQGASMHGGGFVSTPSGHARLWSTSSAAASTVFASGWVSPLSLCLPHRTETPPTVDNPKP